MYDIDSEFKMSYDQRNDQEIAARSRRQANNPYGRENISYSRSNSMSEEDTSASESKGLRWAFMVGLAMLGIGTGYELGRDQYNMRSKSVVV